MLNKQQIEKAFHLLCSAEEAARVSWRVVGMRAALLSYAFATHFVLKNRDDARLALGLSDEDWARFGDYVLEYWQESAASGQLMLAPPKAARRPRLRKELDNFSPSSYGKALPLALVAAGPTKVAELPGESAARAAKESFETVWAAYPNKSNKTYAEACFKRASPSDDDVKAILHDLSLRQFTKKWSDDSGAYIPNPSTYFNNRVWTQPLMLTELELAASVLSAQERQSFFAKPRREIEGWLGSQKVLGRIPSQADLQARLGLTPFAHRDSDSSDVIDVQFTEAGSGRVVDVPAQPVAVGLMPVAAQKPNLIDPFEVEFMRAVETVADADKRERIKRRDAKGKREWLNAFKTMRAKGGGSSMQSSSVPLSAGLQSTGGEVSFVASSAGHVQRAVSEPQAEVLTAVPASARAGHTMFEREVWI
jgi:hypothetical protein